MEGVLTPEIWIAVAERTGIPELRRTTRDEPDYDKLMRYRLAILKKEGIKLRDIQAVIKGMSPLPGAREFLKKLQEKYQVIILSDTFIAPYKAAVVLLSPKNTTAFVHIQLPLHRHPRMQ